MQGSEEYDEIYLAIVEKDGQSYDLRLDLGGCKLVCLTISGSDKLQGWSWNREGLPPANPLILDEMKRKIKQAGYHFTTPFHLHSRRLKWKPREKKDPGSSESSMCYCAF